MKKTWNHFTKDRMVTKFVGEIRSEAKALKRAAAEVSKKAGVKLHVREAATDNWRHPL